MIQNRIITNHFTNQSFFKDLSDQERKELLLASHIIQCQKSDVIFEEDDPGSVMYFIEEGHVNLAKSDFNGKELILATLHPGNFFGEMALLDNSGRSCRATAATDLVISGITKATFLTLLTNHPHLSIKLITCLSHRLREADRKLEETAFGRVKERLERLLSGISKGNKTILLTVTHKELAFKVGACRETVSRALKELEKEGWTFLHP
jgi:CRP/FNR family cyclic AMP-dependent transcriptional regulator